MGKPPGAGCSELMQITGLRDATGQEWGEEDTGVQRALEASLLEVPGWKHHRTTLSCLAVFLCIQCSKHPGTLSPLGPVEPWPSCTLSKPVSGRTPHPERPLPFPGCAGGRG